MLFLRVKRISNFCRDSFLDKVKEEWDVFNKFLNPRKQSLRMYVKIILMYIMIPATAIAAALFYLVRIQKISEQGRLFD